MEHVLHHVAHGVALSAVAVGPLGAEPYVAVVHGVGLRVLALLGVGTLIGDGDVRRRGGVVFGASQFVPLGCLGRCAHAGVHYARLYRPADGGCAVYGVGGGVVGVAEDAQVGAALVGYRLCEAEGDVAAEGSERDGEVVGELRFARLEAFGVAHRGVDGGQHAHELTRCGAVFEHLHVLCCLCRCQHGQGEEYHCCFHNLVFFQGVQQSLLHQPSKLFCVFCVFRGNICSPTDFTEFTEQTAEMFSHRFH